MHTKFLALIVWVTASTLANSADLCVTGLNSGTRAAWSNTEAINCGQTVAFKNHGGNFWSVSVYHLDAFDTSRELLSANVLDETGNRRNINLDPAFMTISRRSIIVNGVVKAWITEYKFGFTFTAQSGTFTVSMPTSRSKTAPRVSSSITFQ